VVLAVDKLGRFNVGKFRLGKLSGGNDESPEEVLVKLPVGAVDKVAAGKLSDGKDNGGIVGTDKGGKP